MPLPPGQAACIASRLPGLPRPALCTPAAPSPSPDRYLCTCCSWDASQKPQPALLHEHSGHIDWVSRRWRVPRACCLGSCSRAAWPTLCGCQPAGGAPLQQQQRLPLPPPRLQRRGGCPFPTPVPQVNDLALAGDVLVSCSSDRTLRVWQPDSPGQQRRRNTATPASAPAVRRPAATLPLGGMGARRAGWRSARPGGCPACAAWLGTPAQPLRRPTLPLAQPLSCVWSTEPALGCLSGHSDFVTSVAASNDGARLASGGLRGEVLLWDLARLRAVMAGAAQAGGRRSRCFLLSAVVLPWACLRPAQCILLLHAAPAKAAIHGSLPPPRPAVQQQEFLRRSLARRELRTLSTGPPSWPPFQEQPYGASTAEAPRGSIYALAMSASGALVAAGSTQVTPPPLFPRCPPSCQLPLPSSTARPRAACFCHHACAETPPGAPGPTARRAGCDDCGGHAQRAQRDAAEGPHRQHQVVSPWRLPSPAARPPAGPTAILDRPLLPVGLNQLAPHPHKKRSTHKPPPASCLAAHPLPGCVSPPPPPALRAGRCNWRVRAACC
jgi:hypothetical protein